MATVSMGTCDCSAGTLQNGTANSKEQSPKLVGFIVKEFRTKYSQRDFNKKKTPKLRKVQSTITEQWLSKKNVANIKTQDIPQALRLAIFHENISRFHHLLKRINGEKIALKNREYMSLFRLLYKKNLPDLPEKNIKEKALLTLIKTFLLSSKRRVNLDEIVKTHEKFFESLLDSTKEDNRTKIMRSKEKLIRYIHLQIPEYVAENRRRRIYSCIKRAYNGSTADLTWVRTVLDKHKKLCQDRYQRLNTDWQWITGFKNFKPKLRSGNSKAVKRLCKNREDLHPASPTRKKQNGPVKVHPIQAAFLLFSSLFIWMFAKLRATQANPFTESLQQFYRRRLQERVVVQQLASISPSYYPQNLPMIMNIFEPELIRRDLTQTDNG